MICSSVKRFFMARSFRLRTLPHFGLFCGGNVTDSEDEEEFELQLKAGRKFILHDFRHLAKLESEHLDLVRATPAFQYAVEIYGLENKVRRILASNATQQPSRQPEQPSSRGTGKPPTIDSTNRWDM
jgi:hypothetical protein